MFILLSSALNHGGLLGEIAKLFDKKELSRWRGTPVDSGHPLGWICWTYQGENHACVGVVNKILAVHYTVAATVSLVWLQISSSYANLGAYEVMNHVEQV